jgi:hypothetical protein
MKKIKTIQIIIFLSVTLCSCDSCKKEYLTELPPETQTGANTFGCYVNGRLFIAHRDYAPFGQYHIGAVYSNNLNTLSLYGIGELGPLSIGVINPKLEITMQMSAMRYITGSLIHNYEDIGTVYITKFDTINNIVS